MELVLEIPNIDKIISQNSYLLPASRWINVKGKSIQNHYLYKDPAVKSYQGYIEDYLCETYQEYILEHKEFFKSGGPYIEYFQFNMVQNLNSRDVTNCVKLVEDSIVRSVNWILGDLIDAGELPSFDDSQVHESSCKKVLSDAEYESILYKLHRREG